MKLIIISCFGLLVALNLTLRPYPIELQALSIETAVDEDAVTVALFVNTMVALVLASALIYSLTTGRKYLKWIVTVFVVNVGLIAYWLYYNSLIDLNT